MINGEKVLAIIPARGGSKRLPGKNILPLKGKPLIAWSIEAALNSIFIDKVVVSTDDIEIAEISQKYGAAVPFTRPENLSNDTASSIDVVIHTIDMLALSDEVYDIVVLLQPTSPLRTTEHINQAFNKYVEQDANGVVSVCEAEHSPIWCNTLPADNSLKSFLPEKYKNVRSQDLPTYFRLNGAVYIASISALKKSNSFIQGDKIFAYEMSTKASVDIDSEIDFKLAEFLAKESS